MAGSKRFYFKTLTELVEILAHRYDGKNTYLDDRKVIITPSPIAKGEYIVKIIKLRGNKYRSQ